MTIQSRLQWNIIKSSHMLLIDIICGVFVYVGKGDRGVGYYKRMKRVSKSWHGVCGGGGGSVTKCEILRDVNLSVDFMDR